MINEYENTLRELITSLIGSSDTSNYKVSPERIEKWKEKREIEKKKNKGILLEPRLIYYSDFYDINTIIEKNWDIFSPILNDKKRFSVFFKEIEQFRNTLAHGRKLIASQESLLSGILMDLKNAITIFHNKNHMKDDYFIELIKVSDNLGNFWGKSVFERSGKPNLKVGDQYELLIEANDPKDRKIQYEILTLGLNFSLKQESNRFIFQIGKELIGQNTLLLVKVSTPDSEYKNEIMRKISIIVYPE
ncbi:hypothetical protein [Pontibacter harenae]|uniref:hypothetical protein n=1 Tax=Pontibacter harenae TaxID=2894083 RepID=UPI001E2FF404|nr:hypothetical protein [Pontibacter harenae]MCC9166391.1 hypothetical protein [Pontibacter harenae]